MATVDVLKEFNEAFNTNNIKKCIFNGIIWILLIFGYAFSMDRVENKIEDRAIKSFMIGNYRTDENSDGETIYIID